MPASRQFREARNAPFLEPEWRGKLNMPILILRCNVVYRREPPGRPDGGVTTSLGRSGVSATARILPQIFSILMTQTDPNDNPEGSRFERSGSEGSGSARGQTSSRKKDHV